MYYALLLLITLLVLGWTVHLSENVTLHWQDEGQTQAGVKLFIEASGDMDGHPSIHQASDLLVPPSGLDHLTSNE